MAAGKLYHRDRNPYATLEIIDGIREYMEKNQIEDIYQLIGAVK